MRNHGFLLTESGWKLSPAYDINPEPAGTGLHLNVSEDDNSLDLNLARTVAEFFRVDGEQADAIVGEVVDAVRNWREVASRYGIGRGDQEQLQPAFKAAE